jgi:hypothetical protein
VIDCFSARGFPLEEASEHFFLSIKVSFLVLWFSTFCFFVGIFRSISIYCLLQYIRVETCTIDIFKAQRYVIQWVKLWWGRLHTRNIDGFTELSRNQCFTLLETYVTPFGTL